MAYSEALADRLRGVFSGRSDVREQRMFGGLTFMVAGNMACGVSGDELMVRVGRDAYAEALAQPHTREMTFTGRALEGMVFVAPEGIATEAQLQTWVERGVAYAGTRPSKPARRPEVAPQPPRRGGSIS